MTARALVDSNVLLYCYDRSEPAKQQQALRVVDQLATTRAGALTTQVLGEFFVNAIRKLPMPFEEAAARIDHYLRAWPVLDVTSRVVEEAVRGVRAYGFNYWDAQIWAAARVYGLSAVFSEDFAAGAALEGVRFVNPLGASFELTDWL